MSFQVSGQPKISNFDLHFIVEEDIAQLDIPVEYVHFMQILNAVDNLSQIILGLELCYPNPPLEELLQRVILTQLQHNINIMLIFKHLHKLAYTLVIQRSIYIGS